MGDDWTVGELIRVLCGADVSMDTRIRMHVYFNGGKLSSAGCLEVDNFHIMTDRKNGGLMLSGEIEQEEAEKIENLV